jgi:hypothetical protein
MPKRLLVELLNSPGDRSNSVKVIRGSGAWYITYSKGGVVIPPGILWDHTNSKG